MIDSFEERILEGSFGTHIGCDTIEKEVINGTFYEENPENPRGENRQKGGHQDCKDCGKSGCIRSDGHKIKGLILFIDFLTHSGLYSHMRTLDDRVTDPCLFFDTERKHDRYFSFI